MGVNYQTAKWLGWLAAGGVQYGRMLTLGRQDLFMPSEQLRALGKRFGYTDGVMDKHLSPMPRFIEPLLMMYGATAVESMDASDFEGASIIHDLNNPVGPELVGQFDTVFDGGTLEHVFNFPEGLRNAMRMLRVGGAFLSAQCFNNMVGHGFYCFGPEVFFRALSEENGFAIKNIHIYERYPFSPWRRLTDPNDLGARLRLISWGLEVEVIVHAVKTRDVPIFAKWPQQSDYSTAWRAPDAASPSSTSNEDMVRLGVRSTGLVGRVKAATLRTLRDRAHRSPTIGRLGKYWLNARNFGLRAQAGTIVPDDPFHGGGPPRL